MKEKHFNQSLKKNCIFVALSLCPTLYLVHEYINYQNKINILLTNIQFMSDNKSVFPIIIYFFFINLVTVYLYLYNRNDILYKNNKLFLLPVLHVAVIMFSLVYGFYGNKKCEDLPPDRKCGCYYVAAKENIEGFKDLFNESCKKDFFVK